MTSENKAYNKLIEAGVHPSAQRLAIMEFLMENHTHPTVEDVYKGLCPKIPTLSRTTVYNTLRLFSEHQAAQMITIDEHRVCYDGCVEPHVHFYCKKCKRVIDLPEEDAPKLVQNRNIHGNIVDEIQLYYKGICTECAQKEIAAHSN